MAQGELIAGKNAAGKRVDIAVVDTSDGKKGLLAVTELYNNGKEYYEQSNFDVNELLLPVATFVTKDVETLGVSIEVKDNALDDLALYLKYSRVGEWTERTPADWTVSTDAWINEVAGMSNAAGALAVGVTGIININVKGVYAIQLWAASGNAAGSTTIINAGGE